VDQNPQNLRDAIVFLKHARTNVVARLADGSLKTPDTAHLYAFLALALMTGE
jgi:hypothetical protein